MKAITVKIPDALRVRLQAEAARRGVSLGAVVREAAETYVVEAPKVGRKISFYEKNKDLSGIFASGVPDLGSNPKHLDGYGLDLMHDSGHRPAGGLPRSKRTKR